MSKPYTGEYPAGFTINPAEMPGNTQSAHHVVFGKLGEHDVALKPYYSDTAKRPNKNVESAEHEARMYRLLSSLGYSTLTPMGIERLDDGTAFLVTEKRPRLLPVAAVNMHPSTDDGQRLISDTAEKIADLHKDRITHGDARPRNFVIDRLKPFGEIIVVDLESTQRHNTKGRGNTLLAGGILSDLDSFGFTLGKLGYSDPTERDNTALFTSTFLDPYASNYQKAIPKDVINASIEAFQRGQHEYAVLSGETAELQTV